jgi:uncharacterized metal-binding protein
MRTASFFLPTCPHTCRRVQGDHATWFHWYWLRSLTFPFKVVFTHPCCLSDNFNSSYLKDLFWSLVFFSLSVGGVFVGLLFCLQVTYTAIPCSRAEAGEAHEIFVAVLD